MLYFISYDISHRLLTVIHMIWQKPAGCCKLHAETPYLKSCHTNEVCRIHSVLISAKYIFFRNTFYVILLLTNPPINRSTPMKTYQHILARIYHHYVEFTIFAGEDNEQQQKKTKKTPVFDGGWSGGSWEQFNSKHVAGKNNEEGMR